jgi:hypothetical protein
VGDCPQSFQESAEDAFLFVVIAVADPHAPSVAQILAARNKKHKRAVASVVCLRASTLAFSSRLIVQFVLGRAIQAIAAPFAYQDALQ